MREVTARSRLREVCRHPLGRDIVDGLAHRIGRSPRWVDNPLVGAVRLAQLPRITGGRVDDAFVDALVRVLASVPGAPPEAATVRDRWERSAVVYQVYPRSFADSDGDGIGDLRGILSRLDHLQRLGVDALWLSPVYDSPNDDNGYDIRDYRAIMTEFGTLADFDALVAGLHERGMRLIMDLVVNHTSDEHPWFRAALADPDSPFRDYYFLRHGTPGTPPNNWRSFFSGPAWRWFPEAGVWGLHLFSERQMDLDWTNPAVRAEVADIVAWWRERGVDGFRLDVINLISKADGLPAGNTAIGALTGFTGLEHYFHGPALHAHLRELRAAAFGDAVAIGETPAIGAQIGRLLVAPERGELDLVFTFEHLDAPGKTRFDRYRYDLRHLRRHLLRQQAAYEDGAWPTLFFDNHDNPRMVSKIDDRPAHRVAVAKLLATIQLTVRGTPFLYQGQEIGAVDQRFASLEELRDVESRNLAAELVAAGASPGDAFARVLAGSRDHARVPMAWDAAGGFTTGEPWLAGDGSHAQINVADQESDPDSVLTWHRRLIALRRAHTALTLGRFVPERAGRRVWRYRRERDGEVFLVVLNLSDRPARTRRPGAGLVLELASGGGRADGRLDPYEAQVWRGGAGT